MRARRSAERRPLPPGFGVIWMAVVLDLVGFGIIIPVLPLYAEDLGASPRMIGLVLATYSLAQFVGAPVLGRLSDRHGRKPVLVLALFGSALGHLLTGLAAGLPLLFLARALDGLSGGSVSVAQAAASDLAEPADRPRLFGLLGAAFGLGFVLGPAIGGLAVLGGKHVPFYVAAVLAAINGVLAIVRVKETRVRGAVPAAGPAAAAAAAAHPRPSGHRLGAVVGLVRRGGWTSRLVLVSALGVLAFTALESTFSLAAQDRLGLGAGAVAGAFVVIGLVLVLLQGGATARVVGRLGAVNTARLGLGLNVVGFVVLAALGGWAGMIVGTLVLVVGTGLLNPSLTTALSSVARPAERGTVFGVQQSMGALSRVIGPVVALALYDRVGVGSPYLLAAASVAVALLVLRPVVSAVTPAGGPTAHRVPDA